MIAKVLSIATKIFLRQDADATKSGKASGLKARAAGSSFQGSGESRTEVRGTFHGADAGGSHRGVFLLGVTRAAADDRAGMTHPTSWRSGLAGDESDDGLLHVGLDPFRGAFFSVAADFANQNNGVGVRIVV